MSSNEKIANTLAEQIGHSLLKINEVSEKIGLLFEDTISAIQKNFEIIRPQIEKLNEFSLQIHQLLIPVHVANKLADSQIVITTGLPVAAFDEILQSENMDKTYMDMLEKNDYRNISLAMSETEEYFRNSELEILLRQTFEAYSLALYNLAMLGLLAILDGVLSMMSQNITTNLLKRVESIIDNRTDDDFPNIIFVITLYNTIKSLSSTSHFEDAEPDSLNRHWIMHGRTRKEYSQLDCVKLINVLQGIIILRRGIIIR